MCFLLMGSPCSDVVGFLNLDVCVRGFDVFDLIGFKITIWWQQKCFFEPLFQALKPKRKSMKLLEIIRSSRTNVFENPLAVEP